jgi:hypothetical protein
MENPGATLFHELMHWSPLTLKQANVVIEDWTRPKDPGIDDPPNGYGPYVRR